MLDGRHRIRGCGRVGDIGREETMDKDEVLKLGNELRDGVGEGELAALDELQACKLHTNDELHELERDENRGLYTH